jgi:hypothetical protein
MLKHAGRAHDPVGAMNFKDGELALDCIADVLPGKNITEEELAQISDEQR